MKSDKGFTLVELIAIIILLGALSAFIYINFWKVLERQNVKAFIVTRNGIIESSTVFYRSL